MRVLPKPYLLALAVALTLVALAVLSLAASSSLAANPDLRPPPKLALMKGDTVVQKGLQGSTCWTYWVDTEDEEAETKEAREGHWTGYCADYTWRSPRRAVLVHPRSTLHVRLHKPQRPNRVHIEAYPGFAASTWDKSAGDPVGKPQFLTTTLRRVERDDETVAWDVFFRVKEPHRHYHLGIWVFWERVPGTHISYGDTGRFFHVRTF